MVKSSIHINPISDPISGKLSHPRDFIFQDFSSEPLPINGQRSPVDGSNMWKIPYLLAVKSPICAKRVCPKIRYCTYIIDCHCWLSMFPMFCHFGVSQIFRKRLSTPLRSFWGPQALEQRLSAIQNFWLLFWTNGLVTVHNITTYNHI